MRFFVLEGRHLVPLDQIPDELRRAHFQFLESGYRAGHFLVSGPKLVESGGGYLVARASSREVLDELLREEPFTAAGVMVFETVTQFLPRQHLPAIADWCQPENSTPSPAAIR